MPSGETERPATATRSLSEPDVSSKAESIEGDSIFALASSVDQEFFRRAFSQLDEGSFTRTTRTSQFDDEGRRIAFEESVVRYHGPPPDRRSETIRRTSAGAFDFGYLRPFVSRAADSRDRIDLPNLILSDDPSYLSPRNREAYSYRLLPDTSMWDVAVRVIDVRARPQAGDGQEIRRVRLYVSRRANRLVGLYLERIDRALWFREESIFQAEIRPVADGAWLPHYIRFETRVGIPFRSAQRFRTEEMFGREDVGR